MITQTSISGNETTGPSFMPVTAKGKSIKLAMQDLFLTGKIMPVGARLMVKHTFTSSETKPIEVVYAFMLPRDASLRRFQISGKGFSSRSKLLPLKEAKRAYEGGIEKGHLASLAQVYRDGVVNLNVGNVRPGETVTVLLEILAGVDLQDDSFRFRFPFTLAPTYHTKARAGLTAEGDGEIQLPEDEFGDVILPTFKQDATNLHRVGFDLEVIAPAGIAEVGSTSHAVRISDLSGQGARVQLATDHALPNSDLVLDVRTKGAFTGVLAGSGKDGRCHFAGIVASPAFGKAKTAARRLVFLLDRSGSMEGERIQQAKSAILACIGALGPKDQIGFVAFDTQPEAFRPNLATADQSTRDALKTYLANVSARGGTELLAGVQSAVGILGKEGGDIFLVTDGEVSGTEDILAAVKVAKVRIHALGINSASQDRFLTLIARQTGGISRFVTPKERVDVAALGLFATTGTSVATNVRVGVKGGKEATIAPDPALAVFTGHPLVILGSLASGKAKLVVDSDESVNKRIELPIEPDSTFPADTLRLLQGARLITDLESQFPQTSYEEGRPDRQVTRMEALLEKLSGEYGLASRVMALVAVVERKGDKVGKVPETRIVPVGMPPEEAPETYFCTSQSAPSMKYSSRCCSIAEPTVCASSPPPDVFNYSDVSDRKRVDDVDTAFNLAGMIEADGGMPGRDEQERLAATLITMLTLVQICDEAGPELFMPQLERLTEYVRNVSHARLSPERCSVVVNQVLAIVDSYVKGAKQVKSVSADWCDVARRYVLVQKDQSTQAWSALEKLSDKTVNG
jgi:Ca-activated chloride channel family protein